MIKIHILNLRDNDNLRADIFEIKMAANTAVQSRPWSFNNAGNFFPEFQN